MYSGVILVGIGMDLAVISICLCLDCAKRSQETASKSSVKTLMRLTNASSLRSPLMLFYEVLYVI